MPQNFVYRDMPYTIGDEIDGRREWLVGPETEQPQDQGVVTAATCPSTTAIGTFRRAVQAAWQAIDKMLDGEMTPKPS